MRGYFVHPFDDDRFIAGNGTLGLEILEDLPDVDAIVAPLGGGGLLAGIAAAVRELRPADAHLRRGTGNRGAARASLAAGRPVFFDGWTASFVDGAGGKSVLETMWPLLAPLTGSIVVTLDEVARAMRLVAERAHDHCRRRRRMRGRRRAQRARRHRKNRRRRVRRQYRSAAVRVARRRSPFMNRYAGLPSLPARLNRLDELAVDLWWSWHHEARARIPRARLPAVARDRPQPGADAVARFRGRSSNRPRRDPAFLALYDRADRARSTPRARRSNTWWAEPLPAARAASRSRISRPSSRCTSRCRSTPAASACSPAITARKPATSACRSSASASCTRRAISISTSPPKAGRKKATSG